GDQRGGGVGVHGREVLGQEDGRGALRVRGARERHHAERERDQRPDDECPHGTAPSSRRAPCALDEITDGRPQYTAVATRRPPRVRDGSAVPPSAGTPETPPGRPATPPGRPETPPRTRKSPPACRRPRAPVDS